MSKRTSIHSDTTTARDTEEQVILSAQQELDIFSEFERDNIRDIIYANLPRTLEEGDNFSSSPIIPNNFLSSYRKNSRSFSLSDETLRKSNVKLEEDPEIQFNIAAQVVPESQESIKHQSVRPLEPSRKPSSVIQGVSINKEVSAPTESPRKHPVKEVSAKKEIPHIIEKSKKTHNTARTPSKASSSTTITELSQNVDSSIVKNSSKSDQVIMMDEPKRGNKEKKLKPDCLTGLLLCLFCSCCCSRCKRIYKKNKRRDSLPTSEQPKAETKIIDKRRRRNYCICCLIIIIIIILLLLLVIFLVKPGKSSLTNDPASNNGTVTNPSGKNQTISQSALFCLSTFNSLVPSLARNFSCDSCGVDDTFYNITQFCVLKSIWANVPNKTALESQGWLQSRDVCKWSGIVCDNSGNITEMNLSNPRVPNILDGIGIGRLTTLQKLTIIGTVQEPSGNFPNDFFKLNNLGSLNIQSTNLTSLSDSFNLLSSLKNLTFANNRKLGSSVPQSIGSLSLTSFAISGQGLTGNIPDFIVNSKTLQSSLVNLDLSVNSLTGPIPSSLSQFNSLNTIILELNNLSSSIPDFSTYGSAKSIRNLQLGSNGLTGQIPTSISSLTNLVVLQLQNNRLSGNIPSQIGSMNNLQQLDLSRNGLTGSIPDSVAALNVPKINLASNSLSGTIPSAMCKNSYTQCSLSSNNLTVSGTCGVCLT